MNYRDVKFTKGKWYACCVNTPKDGCHCGYIFSEESEGEMAIADISINEPGLNRSNYCEYYEITTYQTQQANQRLIAAAPDMYWKLVEIYESKDCPPGIKEILDSVITVKPYIKHNEAF